jgi:hypothetical protein
VKVRRTTPSKFNRIVKKNLLLRMSEKLQLPCKILAYHFDPNNHCVAMKAAAPALLAMRMRCEEESCSEEQD